MGVLSELEPKAVFRYFEEICSIPHPSYKEKRISDYVVSFAKEHHLTCIQDPLHNIILFADATEGYEDEDPIILQGHLDMVCEKTEDSAIDFDRDGLSLFVDGDDVRAKNTTLGGDDGIAVAYALAILDSDDIPHPALEVIFTVCEEVGMEGATGIDLALLRGKKLLNLDSEDEGVMTVSCAGGNSTCVYLPVARETMTAGKLAVTISGCMGGHSGVEINKGRSNPNLMIGRILLALKHADIRFGLLDLSGGAKQNAIPTAASVRILTTDPDQARKIARSVFADLKAQYQMTDPDLRLAIDVTEPVTESVAVATDFEKLLFLLNHLPRGVQAMSKDIEGLVETSLNLGILELKSDVCVFEYSVRSSIASELEALTKRIRELAEPLGASVKVSGIYPPWEYKKDSVLRDDAVRLYEEMYGKKPVVEAIHAGLECGILAGKISGLDAISIGPDIKDIHTVKEALSISSTARVYEFIKRLLAIRHQRPEN